MADCGDLPDAVPGGGGHGRHHEVLLHELGRRQSQAGAGIAGQVKGPFNHAVLKSKHAN